MRSLPLTRPSIYRHFVALDLMMVAVVAAAMAAAMAAAAIIHQQNDGD